MMTLRVYRHKRHKTLDHRHALETYSSGKRDTHSLAETARTIWSVWLDRVSKGPLESVDAKRPYSFSLAQMERKSAETMAAPAGIGHGQEDAR